MAQRFLTCFINVYIACDKECAMATRVPNPITKLPGCSYVNAACMLRIADIAQYQAMRMHEALPGSYTRDPLLHSGLVWSVF